MKKHYLIGILLTVLLILSIPTYAPYSYEYNTTETQCKGTGGTWEEWSGCDPKEGDTCPIYYCNCENGYRLTNEGCVLIPNEELCTNSDGQWINKYCICPEDYFWTEGLGCNPTIKSDIETNTNSQNGFFTWLSNLFTKLLSLLKF
jgi:hypothetical protein